MHAGALAEVPVNRITSEQIAEALRPIWNGPGNNRGSRVRRLVEVILTAKQVEPNPCYLGAASRVAFQEDCRGEAPRGHGGKGRSSLHGVAGRRRRRSGTQICDPDRRASQGSFGRLLARVPPFAPSDGYRPRGSALASRTAHAELDRHRSPATDRRSRAQTAAMSVLRSANRKTNAPPNFVTQ